jgi:hypothetical protein
MATSYTRTGDRMSGRSLRSADGLDDTIGLV